MVGHGAVTVVGWSDGRPTSTRFIASRETYPMPDHAPLDFRSAGVLTLGVEIEVQLVDWRTKDLCPAAPRILAAARDAGERVAPEIFQSMLELRTGVCHNLADVTGDLHVARAIALRAAKHCDVEIIAAGTHPFARSHERLAYPSPRYQELIDRNQWIARRLAIFGLHVHVGMRDGDHAVAVMNGLLPHLATLLALSSSSPFMEAQDTGLSSARATVFESQPTAGTPPTFRDWSDFVGFYERLVRSRAVASPKDLWWDVRPSPGHGTLEVRVCDVPSSLDDTLALVALVQCLAADLTARIDAGDPPPQPAQWRLRENKWRAARWGLDADLVVDDEGHTRSLRDEAIALVGSLASTARALGCVDELALVERLIEGGTSAERQRRLFARSRSVLAVVEALAETWRSDPAPPDGRGGDVARLSPIGGA